MNYYIVIPAHNEEAFLADTLNSVLRQSLLPKKIVVVNDNSSDETEAVIDKYLNLSNKIEKLNATSSDQHMPGSKVVNAFYKGLQLLDTNYDFIVKLDADIILPDNYFERIAFYQTLENIEIIDALKNRDGKIWEVRLIEHHLNDSK